LRLPVTPTRHAFTSTETCTWGSWGGVTPHLKSQQEVVLF
jgi:hypothetical protein